MPKILQISSCLKGSTGTIAQQIGEEAIEAGWESWIAYSGREVVVPSQSHIFPIGSKFDAQIHAIETRLFDRHGLGSRSATKRLVEKIKEIKPDVIHLHNIHGYYINIKVLFDYLSKAGIPVVWTLHDCWAFTGHCVHYTDVKCNKWKPSEAVHCCNCPKKKGYPTSYFLDRSAKNYALKSKLFTSVENMTIVPVSHWLGSVTAESFLGKYPIGVIQNGIDVSRFYPRTEAVTRIREKYGWDDKFVILGVAKGWSEDVGMQHFYRLRELLDDNYAIAMVGLTADQMKKLPDGITGIMRTYDANELAEIYTTADLFFNGSYQETFGLVTAEAMACGTKVMVFDSTACGEIVSDETGYILPVGGLDEFVPKIIEMARCSERSSVCSACKNYVRQNLDKDMKYQEYVELYKSLI